MNNEPATEAATEKPVGKQHTTGRIRPQSTDTKLITDQRRLAAQQAAANRKKQEAVRRLGVIIAVLLVVGGGALTFLLRGVVDPQPEIVDMQASHPHIANPSAAHPTYTTDPPTSGPHFDSLPSWKVYSEPITKELQVHGLEDGGVIINYQPALDSTVVERLAALTKVYNEQTDPKNRVVMSPYPGLDHPIVLTAWRVIYRLNNFDEGRIKRFVDAYVGIDRHKESAAGPALPDANLTPSPPP